MPLRFLFVRHAEAEHNAAYHAGNKDLSVFTKKEYQDAPLTEKGRLQAKELVSTVSKVVGSDPVILWSSPLRRCLQTADEFFEELYILHYYAHDALLEVQTQGYVCNKRAEKRKLLKEFGHVQLDFLPEFPSFWLYSEPLLSVEWRFRMFLSMLLSLYAGKNQTIVVVGHANTMGGVLSKDFKNAEWIELSEEEVKAFAENRSE